MSRAYEFFLNIGINVIKAITIMPMTKKLLKMPLKTLENRSFLLKYSGVWYFPKEKNRKNSLILSQQDWSFDFSSNVSSLVKDYEN
jgi:hypothetical protein